MENSTVYIGLYFGKKSSVFTQIKEDNKVEVVTVHHEDKNRSRTKSNELVSAVADTIILWPWRCPKIAIASNYELIYARFEVERLLSGVSSTILEEILALK